MGLDFGHGYKAKERLLTRKLGHIGPVEPYPDIMAVQAMEDADMDQIFVPRLDDFPGTGQNTLW